MTAYVLPSQCEACVPAVTHSDYVTDYAHETTCPSNQENPNG